MNERDGTDQSKEKEMGDGLDCKIRMKRTRKKIVSFVSSRRKEDLIMMQTRAQHNSISTNNNTSKMTMLRLLYATLILSPAAGALVQVMASGKKTFDA